MTPIAALDGGETWGGLDVIGHQCQLAELHEQGALTDEEFATEKAKLLAG